MVRRAAGSHWSRPRRTRSHADDVCPLASDPLLHTGRAGFQRGHHRLHSAGWTDWHLHGQRHRNAMQSALWPSARLHRSGELTVQFVRCQPHTSRRNQEHLRTLYGSHSGLSRRGHLRDQPPNQLGRNRHRSRQRQSSILDGNVRHRDHYWRWHVGDGFRRPSGERWIITFGESPGRLAGRALGVWLGCSRVLHEHSPVRVADHLYGRSRIGFVFGGGDRNRDRSID